LTVSGPGQRTSPAQAADGAGTRAPRRAAPADARPSRSRRLARNSVLPIVTTLAFLGLWEAGVRVLEVQAFVLPPPSAILEEFWTARDQILVHSIATLVAVVIGFGLAALLAVPLAFAIVLWRPFERAVYPILVASQTVPKIAIIPLLVVWFGFGQLPKLILALLISFFPIVIDTTVGLRSVPTASIDLIRSMSGSRWDVFRYVRIPASLPYMFSGLKIGVTLAVVGAVVGEFVGSTEGLGVMIVRASGVLNTRLVFAGIIALSVLGVVLFYAVVALERMFVSWHDTQRSTDFTP
jgi:NitT/TauT family transport system permease protein